MKLKTRLLASFLIIFLIPIAMGYVALMGFEKTQENRLKSEYGFEGDASGISSFMSGFAVELIAQLTQSDYKKLEGIALNTPELLSDDKYVGELNEELMQRYSYLVIREDEDIVFYGSGDVVFKSTQLAGFEAENASSMYAQSATKSLVRKLDFISGDGRESSLFMVTQMADILPQFEHIMLQLVCAIIIILAVTAVMLVTWTYQGINLPVANLARAMKNVGEGNLDFEIKPGKKDEIGQLTNNFIEMRRHLKESLDEKLAGETENRILINNITHDLKTPITSIKGYVEGIMDGVADSPEKMDKYIKTIYNKANEMDTLINELTVYANIDTNRTPYNFNKLNVGAYFADCAEELELELEDEGIKFSYNNYVDSDTIIIADPEQLHRVISNITGNSIKYIDRSKDECSIAIRIKDDGDFIQVEIEDNGRGISKEDMPSIFDRFFRADSSRNSSTGGSGIGLSIVRKIIEDHGGKVWATSQEGIGTIMHFVIRKYKEGLSEQDTDSRGRGVDSGVGTRLSGAVRLRGRGGKGRQRGTEESS